jgi:cellulose synthase/poly-beta-1,6-N-acetylglucosamine synthase-like glycosyltransferase
MSEWAFWICFVAILYTYLGYPLVIWLLGRVRNKEVQTEDVTPRVSVVIACHNEQNKIVQRIRNLTETHYPADLLEIIVVSDGSTDRTAELARGQSPECVRVIGYDRQKGKATALNVGVENATGEIIVFADARQSFNANAISALVSNFSDPKVGGVTGELLIDGGGTVGDGVGLYWKYEKWIRRNESLAGSVIGATGAIYAIRRGLWRPLAENTILDDVYTPMRIALSGSRIVFDGRARAVDRAAESKKREFARKVRTLTGNYQLCQLMPRLLIPNNLLLFQFYSHKLMRLVAPILLMVLMPVNVILAVDPPGGLDLVYQTALATQSIFYGCVLAGALLPRFNRSARILNFAFVFSLMNAAALIGLIYFVSGKKNVWVRSE